MTSEKNCDVSIGDDAAVVAVGNNISQYKVDNKIYITLDGLLENYAVSIEKNVTSFKLYKVTDWITISVVLIFFLLNIASIIIPLIVYHKPLQEASLPLLSAITGVTALMGVVVGHRFSTQHKIKN